MRLPSLAGCPIFPAENAWNRDVSADPADPHSTDYLAFMGASSLYLQPDFGGPYGQPFVIAERYASRPTRPGKLYLHIGPSPWNCDSSGSFRVKITTDAGD